MLPITAMSAACNRSSKRMTKEVAKQLKKFVEQSIYDRETIRSAVGVDRSTMSRHLNGKLSLTYNKIEQYSRALDINVHQLIGVSPIRVLGQCWQEKDLDCVAMYDIDDRPTVIYPTIGYDKDIVCILKKEDSLRPWLSNSVVCFSEKNMREKRIPENMVDTYCFVKYRKENNRTQFKLAIPYVLPLSQDGKRKYSLVSPSTPGQIKQEDQVVDIVYACPILDWVLKAKTKDWKVVTEERETL
tara:strand:- start:652 stop:1380 length:729 start_codon:yes stop_codon:yes gene_type:complete